MAFLARALRPARRNLTPKLLRPLSTRTSLRAAVSNAPPRDPPVTGEMGVGELEGAKFKIEPLRRVGEDEQTMRARLTYQSRKRGILESDLLLSTFADTYLPTMTKEQMVQYDLFLDENDWDIYYWATQEPPAEGAEAQAQPAADEAARKPGTGEWAQTVGTFKPAYRPVPARWKDSAVLELLREHVKTKSQGKGGMAFMPALKSDQ